MWSEEVLAAKKELDQAVDAIYDYCHGEHHPPGMYERLVANLKQAMAKFSEVIEQSDT